MRNIFSVRRLLLLLPLTLSSLLGMGQVVTDPSTTPGYDAAKLQTASQVRAAAPAAGTTAAAGSRAAAAQITASAAAGSASLAASGGCFIPRDASYTAIARNDDGSFGPIALPFTFNLYGSAYTQVWINTNGNLTFTGAYSSFSSTGFPANTPMVAPFWADVDTRNAASGQIYYKLSATNLIVTWDGVGYYSNLADKKNTFQAIIGSSTDALLGPGQNVSLRYGDMQWTTGSASSGVGGFGGIPATVGVNKGDNVSYVQVGRFSVNSSIYDGPGGNQDGINYLDGQCFGFQVSNAGNIPPSANNIPLNNTVTVYTGQTVTINPQFLAPEVNQTVSLAVDAGGLCNTTVSTTSGATATATIAITGAACNVGTHPLVLTATDNGSPVGVTMVTLNVVVIACDLQLSAVPNPVTCPGGTDGAIDLTVANGTAPFTYSWSNGATTQDLAGVPAGTYTVTVTDANRCTTTGTYPVGQQDNVAPVAVAQNLTVQLDASGNATITAAQVDNGSTDNCSVASVTVAPAAFTCANVGTNPVTLTVTDASGNVSTATADVTVQDATPPVAVAQDLTVALDATGNATIAAAQVDNGSADACGIAALAVSPSAFTCANVGSNPVTLTVTDLHGNVSTTTAIVTVQDVTAPVAAAQNLTIQLDASGNASLTAAQVDNGSTDACGIASVTVSPSAFTCANTGANPVTLTVTDTHGNVSTTTAIVTVEDHVAPVAVAQNLTIQLDATGNASLTPAQVNNGSSDACGIASLEVAPSTFTCANVGPNTVTLVVSDTHGNVSTTTAIVTVQDMTAPVAVAQNLTVQLNASGTAAITAAQVDNGSSDACGIASVVVAPSTFTCANVGPNNVTLTVTDTHGNVSTATAVVTVTDVTAPVAVAKNITVQLDATGKATITAAQVNNNSTDNCGIASLAVSPSTFTCANYGANTVTLTVKDTNGNVSTTTAVVTVEDRVAPVALAKNITVPLNASGAVTITAAQVNNGSTDNCGIASVVVSPSTFSCAHVGANTVTLTVTDTRGNVSTTTAIVTVTDVTAPTVVTQNLTVLLNASGQATITAAQVNNGSNDACGIASVVVSPSTFTCANTGANTVTLTVTDVRGNVSRGTATVTVRDNIAPTLSACPANVVVTAAPNDCTPAVTWTAPVGADNCSFTLTSTAASGSRFPVGTTPVTYTVTDASGNKATCSFTVTVKASPVVVALSSPTYSGGVNVACNGGTSGSATATVTGGCQPYRYLWSNGQTTATAKNLAAGTYAVTVTDANNTSVTQRITLTQPTAPVVVSTSYSPQFTCTGGQTSTIYLGYGLQYLTLNASATGGTGAYSYSWSPAAGLNRTTGNCVVASPQVTTVYTVTATDANGCASSKQFTVYVYNLFCGPYGTKIAMCNNGRELCVDVLAVPFQILMGSTLGSCTYGNNARSAEAPATSTLTAKLTVEAYPNPSDGIFRVRVKAPASGTTKVQLYDLQGRLMNTVFEGELQANEQRELTIDQPGLGAGTYLLRVQSGALSENLRLTVQH